MDIIIELVKKEEKEILRNLMTMWWGKIDYDPKS